MEYYDSVNKLDLHMFYFEKCNRLLKNEKVIEVLDTLRNKINFNDNKDIKLFDSDPYINVNSGLKNRRRSMSDKDLSFVTRESAYTPAFTEVVEDSQYKSKLTRTEVKSKKNENKYLNRLRAQEEVCNLDLKMTKILENVSKEMGDQKSNFERLKNQKIQSLTNKNKIKSYTTFNTETNYSSTPSTITLEEELLTKDILFKQQKDHVIQSMMLRDIEEYIEKNMREMHMALDELKLSFEEEISYVDGNLSKLVIYFIESVFPDVVNGLRDDMKIELDNMREQYEDQRRVEIEKIRNKYLKQK
jgi:hypothetical protein